MYTRRQRRNAAIVCVLFAAITFFTFFLIVREADHDCRGKDCPVCLCMCQAERTLKQLGDGAVSGVQAYSVSVQAVFLILFVSSVFISASPVSRKVRLNN